MSMLASRSGELFARARRIVPGGVHSNARARSPHPLFFQGADGAHLVDADGDRYLDCLMGSGSIALGHGRAEVSAAVANAVASGLTTGSETPAAVSVAERLVAMIPDAEQIRFANTGTEALMHAVHIARAATGRSGVAKAEGAYHGWFDPLWVSCWPSPQTLGAPDRPASPVSSGGLEPAAAHTVVLPFNDAEATERILRDHADELAMVALEPILIDVGFVPAGAAYLERVRAVTDELGIVLLFDELLTGFRVAPGGARELYGIRPDVATYGKAIANGYPLAAVEGRAELLGLTDPTAAGPVGWVGTYNGHAIPLAAADASLTLLADPAVQQRLDALVDRLRAGFERLSSAYGVAARLAGGGGHFQPYFLAREPRSYRDALASAAADYEIWRAALAERAILVAEKPLLHSALSDAHTEADVDAVLEATEAGFASIARTR